MLFSFAACGNNASKNDAGDKASNISSENKATESKKEDNNKEESKPASSKAESVKKYSSMEEYVNSKEVQAQFDAVKKSLESLPLKMEATGKDNKLIYSYYYTQEVPTEGLKEKLESSLEIQAGTFENIATLLKDDVM